MSFDISQFGFGITGKVPHDVVRELAPLVEQAGFSSMWFNHIPNGNAYASMEVAAEVTNTIVLGSGVTSIDSLMTAREIVDEVHTRRLPQDRLIIGIGASRSPSPLRTVSDGIDLIGAELPGVPVYVGALGPRMRALGVQAGAGVLLNWLTVETAKSAMDDRRADAPESDAKVALYIRCALGEENQGAIRSEAARYESFPNYAANFERLDFRAMDAAVAVTTAAELQHGLAAYQGLVDQPILRAITAEDTLEAYASLVESARN